MELAKRGISQVVFGFLPEQTVDLRNRVWRVKRWNNPNYVTLDQDMLRRELLSAVRPWEGRDGGLSTRLHQGAEIHVMTPSNSGVDVEPFPRLFKCKTCSRLEKEPFRTCHCGAKDWVAFPFVAYHECGYLKEPFIDVCSRHKQVRVNNPRSNNARELKFTCPVCNAKVQDSFRWITCECGSGQLLYNVHRAGTVFNPHSLVVVNPPNEVLAKQLRTLSAQSDTLQWVLNGMSESKPLDDTLSVDTLIEMFMAKGASESVARAMAKAAADQSGGVLQTTAHEIPLDGESKAAAAVAALKLAYATSGGRTTFQDLLDRSTTQYRERYEIAYPVAIAASGLQSVALLDEFPVLTAYFGYTRGDTANSQSKLRWYRDERGGIQLFGLRARTEALMFTLDAMKVAAWLHRQGALATSPSSQRDARIAIAKQCIIPASGEPTNMTTPGSELLRLVHSYSHRLIRTISSFAGTDRDGLAEYLIPLHLTIIIYARSASDFVMGGLQALYENDLDGALREFVDFERRCPLDPGCLQNGGACMACLHTGEPSCRHFNQFLSRPALFGTTGYLGERIRPGV